MDESKLDGLYDLINQIQQLRDIAYQKYCKDTEDVLAGKITDIKEIEAIMDGLCDFGNEEQFIELYRKICKHIYFKYPELVAEHISLFKMLWMTEDDEDD